MQDVRIGSTGTGTGGGRSDALVGFRVVRTITSVRMNGRVDRPIQTKTPEKELWKLESPVEILRED